MTQTITYFLLSIFFWVLGVVFAMHKPRREHFLKRLLLMGVIYVAGMLLLCVSAVQGQNWILDIAKMIGILEQILLLYVCWEISWSIAAYLTIWASMMWQFGYEMWSIVTLYYPKNSNVVLFVILAITSVVCYFTLSKWMLSENRSKIGPRQLVTSVLLFLVFHMFAFAGAMRDMKIEDMQWRLLVLSQIIIAFILYLQNELFKKSLIRAELTTMNLLWKMEQEQYRLSKENINLINHKCHDLKHQIRALRNAKQEDMEKYLTEIEDSIAIYEAIVKTGNDVLDTILTEKSLYCKDRGIVVSCVADGSQMDFINTVDLYAILGNALDNAIEAVEKFKHTQKRQIDVLVHRQKNFLVINIINPIKGTLVYEEELPVTTKGDRAYHGYGLKSMKYIVKKYNGFLTVAEEDGCFSLKILIPIPREETTT